MKTLYLVALSLIAIAFHILRSKDRLGTLAGYCQMFLVLVMITAGLGKITVHDDPRWMSIIGPVWLEEKLVPYGLGLFAHFIAWCQVLIGLLLASRRFRTVGAIALMPMLISILVVTISLNWNGTPYVVAGFIAMNIVLLIQARQQLLPLVGVGSLPTDTLDRGLRGSDVSWAIGSLLILTTKPWVGLIGLFIIALPAIGGGRLLRAPIRKTVPW